MDPHYPTTDEERNIDGTMSFSPGIEFREIFKVRLSNMWLIHVLLLLKIETIGKLKEKERASH